MLGLKKGFKKDCRSQIILGLKTFWVLKKILAHKMLLKKCWLKRKFGSLCGGKATAYVVVCKPILVSSLTLSQAEQTLIFIAKIWIFFDTLSMLRLNQIDPLPLVIQCNLLVYPFRPL